MIHIDKSKCTACGACVRDCVVHVLTKGEDGFPVFRKENERFCLNCQHCLAVCARRSICRADAKSERFSSSAFPTSPTRAFRIRVPCRWTCSRQLARRGKSAS